MHYELIKGGGFVMNVGIFEAAETLKQQDNILIITHISPDGDTLGSAFALCRALTYLGKRVTVDNSDGIPSKYNRMFNGLELPIFEPEFIVAVDIADLSLFGDKLNKYSKNVGLCIDHHPSNTYYAAKTLLIEDAAATTEIILQVIDVLGVPIDKDIGYCLYAGIITDTGCFQHSNTTSQTHLYVARLMGTGINAADITREMYTTRSRARIEIERLALDTLEFFMDGCIAFVYTSQEMCFQAKASESDLEGMTSIARQIEGVEAGITMREKGPNKYKISLRTSNLLNASIICAKFGGGGHARAAGCMLEGCFLEVKNKFIEAVSTYLGGAVENK
jgi:phosphoesterase RecJ-like protein